MIYNVKQGWRPLCEFLECDVPEQNFPLENVASSFSQSEISAALETVKRRLFIVLAIFAFSFVWNGSLPKFLRCLAEGITSA